ncbi:MAG: hypothetical protein KF784_10265 [Fimbriimonadaceae bacterium]|nr:hypothetical protein [Fimbriimonadaceae bacterium]
MKKAQMWGVAFAVAIAIPMLVQARSQEPAQDPLSKPISLSMKATTVEKIVAEVAKKLDMQLEVLPQVKNEILIVSVDNVTGKQLLDKIAAASVGVWVKDGDVMRLQRNFSQMQREDREAAQAATAKIKKEIKELYDEVTGKNKKPDDEFEAEMMQMGMFGGGGSDVKAISYLLMGVDPSLIASVRNNERLVFASPNTRMQRPLPGNVANIISAWVADHNKTAKEREANKNKSDEIEVENVDMKELEEFMKLFGITEPKAVDERPAKVIMVITRGMMGMGMAIGPFGDDSISVELKLYNSKGQVILRGGHQLGFNVGNLTELSGALDPKKAQDTKPDENDTKIEFSKETQSMMTMFSNSMQGGPPKLDEALEKLLLRPDEHDPLSFAQSEALIAIAKAKKLNIVANLSDDEISLFGMILSRGQAMTVNTYLKKLKEDKSLWVTTEGTWMTITPKDPTAARASRTNRVALAGLLANIQTKGMATLDDLAAYAQVAESPMTTPAAQLYLMLFAPGAMQQGFIGMTDWDALRFYGTLNLSQRQTLANDGRLPYGNLAPQQRDLVAKMAFGSSTKLQIGSEQKPEVGGFLALMTQFLPTQDKDYRQEPTEVMPNGLPSNGYVTGNFKEMFIGTATGLGVGMGMMDRMPLGIDELAMFEWMKTDPNMSQMTGEMPQIQQLKPGVRTQYSFSFFVSNDVLFTRTLNDDRIPKDAQPVSISNLPQDVQDQIKKKVEEFKKSPFPMFGGGTVRPPLP